MTADGRRATPLNLHKDQDKSPSQRAMSEAGRTLTESKVARVTRAMQAANRKVPLFRQP
jgi:hypothetical protein